MKKEQQSEPAIFTNTVLLIKPTHFGFDKECAEDDKFQIEPSLSESEVDALAKEEHKGYIKKIMKAGVNVQLYVQHNEKALDSVFPDWFTIQRGNVAAEGLLTIFPMCHPSRRLERNPALIAELRKECKYFVDLSALESKGEVLEGKGSVLYDHRNYKIYCCISTRACESALQNYLVEINKISKHPWKAVTFQGKDRNGDLIYHTDCMMQLLAKHVVLCGATLEEAERARLVDELSNPAKNSHPYKVISDISFEEMGKMCCNIINVKNHCGEDVILMSKKAYKGYSPEHRRILSENYKLMYTDIETLEEVGGGSVRCLLAEYF